MSERMKKRPIKKSAHIRWNGFSYSIPMGILEKYRDKKIKSTLSIDEVFGSATKQENEPGLLLKGLRTREGKSQAEFAEIIGVNQANISAMENGRRTIGKVIAQRIAKQFKIDYRLFL